MTQWEQARARVLAYIRRYDMLQAGDRVVVGVSGGADSVCLLRMLCDLKEELSITLEVLHVNHGLRAEAGEEAHYVEQLCRDWGACFHLEEVDVMALSRELHCSTEEAGRRARYDAFDRLARETLSGRIAVAHNANDRAETQLFHLFRGTGVKGLAGIAPVRDQIIRPLLCLERREIEAILAERGIPYCQDRTNAEDAYTRNRIRHHILPYAEAEISTEAVAHMNRTAEQLAELEDYLAGQTAEAISICVRESERRGEYRIDRIPFRTMHPAIQSRILLSILTELSPERRDIGSTHIDALRELVLRGGNGELMLPFSIRAMGEYAEVRVWREALNTALPQAAWSLSTRVLERAGVSEALLSGVLSPSQDGLPEGKSEDIHTNRYTKWFDYDKIVQRPVLRTRQQGDYLTLSGGGGERIHKTLQNYFTDAKVPRTERDAVPVLADGSHILWVVGYRISEYFKITEQTTRILQVDVRKEL